MQIKLWGVRGSLPSPLAPDAVKEQNRALLLSSMHHSMKTPADVDIFLSQQSPWQHGGYGGNTSCFEVSSDKYSVIVDAGSGLQAYGNHLIQKGYDTRTRDFHIFFTHFHWDHLLGLCFFMPMFLKGHRIHFYAVQPDLESVIRALFKKPFFPVPFEALGATIKFHRLEPRKPVTIGDIELTPYLLDHPDPCWGYRIQNNNKVFSVCVDTECTRVSPEDLGPDLPLYRGVDAMIFDAQYTLTEVVERTNWGHAAAVIGLDIAMREGIREVYFVHHDPSLSDKKIAEAEQQTRDYYDMYSKTEHRASRHVNEVNWKFATEGTVIKL